MMRRFRSLLASLRRAAAGDPAGDAEPATPGAAVSEDAPRTCGACEETAVVCAACGRGACDEAAHVRELFLTRRYGAGPGPAGTRFFFWCGTCVGPVCLDDVGLGVDAPAEVVARRRFDCPRCGGRLGAIRQDGVDAAEAVEGMREFLRRSPTGPEPEVVPFEGYGRTKEIGPDLLVGVPFGPRPRPLRRGEAWETRLLLRHPGGPAAELVLEQRQGGTRLWLRHDGRQIPLRTPAEGREVWSSERLGEHLPWLAGRHLTISLTGDGVLVARVGAEAEVVAEQVGIRPETDLGPEPADLPPNETPPPPPPPDTPEGALRVHVAGLLNELSRRGIWDYAWLEAPRPDGEGSSGFGKRSVLALAGSTDLTYYHIVRVFFRGVRYNTTRRHFSHPDFALAGPVEEHQLRDLARWGEHSFAARVVPGIGGVGHVVADWVEIRTLGREEESTPYRPVHPANQGWWYGS